ncbi:MAG: adenosylcobinamide kinase/adenosylcobinamide-phosphate guanylyltransferase [Ruminococcaceae bacterium]|jgi:adenosylcobinamide kinase/adenosylcobinamide-phosphate guanylyltransferase|nr:adenosylcobinamide kinase/adenosylcobinamide-phosphate guanylyltransferase [Oscillospiraceae bacterium]
MNVLISGGSKNGKTAFAERAALALAGSASCGKRYYVATMIPYDDEDRKRVELHIEERAGLGFTTLEIARNIASALDLVKEDGADPAASTFLVDSTTALLLNEMYPGDYSAPADPMAAERCRRGLAGLARGAGNAVFVSDYIYSDAARYDDFTERYRADLASIDRALAEICDTVIELSCGLAVVHKGGLPQ